MTGEEMMELCGTPDDWLLFIVYRNDGHCVVWGNENTDPVLAADVVRRTAAALSVEYPGGEVPDGWHGSSTNS
jgi:hypothetical protein